MVRWSALLLGQEHPAFGQVASAAAPDGRAAAALSAGSDPDSPARAGKGAPDRVPNEDALLVIDDGDRALIAVADAHFGHQASHALLRALGRASVLPLGIDELQTFVAAIPEGEAQGTESESTLLVAVLDRTSRRAFGLSFGDSTVTVLGEGAQGRPINLRDDRFVSPARPASLTGGTPFEIKALKEGQTLIAFTDGVDRCCYGDAARSLHPRHLVDIERSAGSLTELVETIARRALEGVDGEPGGQDNLAIAALRT